MKAGVAQSMGADIEIDESYFEGLTNAAYKTLEKFGDPDAFMA